MDLRDQCAQLASAAPPRRERTRASRIIAAGGDSQHAAHGGNLMQGLVGSYECERRPGVALVS
jgi:hypothetical protein